MSPSLAILDGRDEIGIGLDIGGQFVARDVYVDQIITGQQIGGLAVGHSLLGQEEHQRHHDQRHVMAPRLHFR